jgi:hypothetical protein
MINTNIAVGAVSQSFQAQTNLANKISNSDSSADAEDIVNYKSASNQTAVSVAVLKKVLDTARAVDIVA